MIKATWYHYSDSQNPSSATLTPARWALLKPQIVAHGGRVVGEEPITARDALAAVLAMQGADS